MFVVRFPTAHGKQIVFVVHLVLAHGKGNTQGNSCQRGLRSVGKKCLSCANKKTHDKLFLCRALRVKRTANNFFAERFFRRALWRRRTAKIPFAVRPKENARQRFSRMAKGTFPVVEAPQIHNSLAHCGVSASA
jgi:hypothetical protein